MTPLGVLAIVGVTLSLASWLRHRWVSRRGTLQLLLAISSWVALWVASASAFATKGMTNLPLHMVSHVVVMFLVPMGLIGSAWLRSLWWLPDVVMRRRLLRWWYLGREFVLPRWLNHPLVALVLLNVVMVLSHTPRVFDYSMSHRWVMDWALEPAYLLSGLFFFHFLISAAPRSNRCRVRWQFVMVVATMFEMLILAMAMSIFTSTSWYSVMNAMGNTAGMSSMPGMGASIARTFHQQQLAAAILWICGDFWAVPVLVGLVRRVSVRDGSLLAALERQSRGVTGLSS